MALSKFGLDPFDWTTYLFQGDAQDKLSTLSTNTRDPFIKSELLKGLAGIQGDRHLELCVKINNRPKSISLA